MVIVIKSNFTLNEKIQVCFKEILFFYSVNWWTIQEMRI